MFGCYYEDLKEYPLFNSPYKIQMKGFIDLNRNDFIFILYSHGQLHALKPDERNEKLMIYSGREEVETLINLNPFLTCYRYEAEMLINHDTELFTSNLFIVEKIGNEPFDELFFTADSTMEFMVMNEQTTNKDKFIDEILSLEPRKENTIDELIISASKIKETKEEIEKNLKKIKGIIDKDYR